MISEIFWPLHGGVSQKDPIVNYFTSLGYKVDWDWQKGQCWYEILHNGILIAQIDMGVPLKDIVEDLTAMSKGKEGTSNSDYFISAPDTIGFKMLCKKVSENKILT